VAVRRRRVCTGCNERFTTYETEAKPFRREDLARIRKQLKVAIAYLEMMEAHAP
jgi:transcriptional regulator NrdR family protein